MQNTIVPKRVSIENLDFCNSGNILNYDNLLIVTDRAFLVFKNGLFQMDAFIIVLCQSGTARIEINCEECQIRDSSILISMPENEISILDFSSDSDIKTVFISTEVLTRLTADMLQKTSFYMGGSSACIFSVPKKEMKSLDPYYLIIRDSLSHVNGETEDVVRNLLQAFVLSILSLKSEYYKDNIRFDSQQERRTFRLMYEKFMKLLSECPRGKYSLSYYSDQLCVSSKYLSRIVTEYSGKGPNYWINLYALSEAKHLLKYSGLTSKQIAYRLNFKTQSAFSKFFKQFTGLTPVQYSQGKDLRDKELPTHNVSIKQV